jgi:hypothetical protein
MAVNQNLHSAFSMMAVSNELLELGIEISCGDTL